VADSRSPALPAARRVLAGGRAEVVEDVAKDGETGVRSALCVPLQSERRLALWLDSRHEEGLFAAADADLLTAFAEQAALALERVRLLAQNQRQRDELAATAAEMRSLNDRLADSLERRTAELRDARADLALVDDAFSHRYPDIVGRGPATLAVLKQVDRVADTGVPVLFEGESGTGKELFARALHASSGRASARFVAENCAALPDTLLENELFGHERGAFTGADAAASGLFERADGGTLFLDEVGDMSVNLQKRLLRCLQEGEVRRVGGSVVRKVDVRVVTATNRDLMGLVREGRFREDLYYRLAVVKVRVPPLRERREDIPVLLDYYIPQLNKRFGTIVERVDEGLMELLTRYVWPGNIRELRNLLESIFALRPQPVVTTADLPDAFRRRLRLHRIDDEKQRLLATLRATNWNKSAAAKEMQWSRVTLYRKLTKYELNVPQKAAMKKASLKNDDGFLGVG
jgi:transcriptional regulator with PAS, ATPase and Fis domain